MDEEHDRESRTGKGASGAGDVQVQALELVLLEGSALLGNDVWGETEQFLLVACRRGLCLRANGTFTND